LVDGGLIFRQPQQDSACQRLANWLLKERNFIPIGVVSKNDEGEAYTPDSAALNKFKLAINPIGRGN
jgi:hypothetical protein